MSEVLNEQIKALGVTSEDKLALLKFLVADMDGFKEFMQKFYTGNVYEDIAKYQLHKRETNRLSLEEFENLFQQDKKMALESLFQEPITAQKVELMGTYKVNHKELYNKLIKNSNRSYLGLVKETHPQPIDVNDDFLLDY